MMAGIRAKNTWPEMMIRRGLHARGFRFRLHDKGLPGKPDLVLPKYRAAIFVHGCFWHGHDCHLFKWPKTRADFWRTKIARNIAVDSLAKNELQRADWRIGIIWECALKGRAKLPIDLVLTKSVEWLRSDGFILEIEGNEARIPF